MATKRSLDGSAPSAHPGKPPTLTPKQISDVVVERAQASLQEIACVLHHRCGVRV